MGVNVARLHFFGAFLSPLGYLKAMIWLLALLLLASLAGMGFRQGVIRVAFSLIGILVGILLAGPLGHLLSRPLGLVGFKNPVLLWVLGPLVAFVLISIIFKAAALPVHQKVDVYFKYHAGDLRLALWERLHRRLGLCLGLANGALYFILIATLIYCFSYWTVQVASSDADSSLVKWLNRLGTSLQDTGFVKVAKAMDPMPESFYDAADVAGLIYQNSLLEARLERYPGFLSLAESPEFQALAADKDFIEMRQKQEPIRTVLDHPQIQAIISNPDLLHTIWNTLKPDLADLSGYLRTGNSPKYDSEKILGRWDFNVSATGNLLRRAKPNLPSKEMKKIKELILMPFARATLVAMPDQNRLLLKDAPQFNASPGAAASKAPQQGQWKSLDRGYEVTLPGSADMPTTVDTGRLVIKAQGMEFVFDRED